MGYIDNISVTITKNVKVKEEVSHYPLLEVLASIKKGSGNLKSVVSKILKIAEKKSRNYLKEHCLPVFIPTGEFSKVADAAIFTYNGIVCIDVDDIKDYEAEKKRLKLYQFILSIMKSPSGNMKIFILTDLKDSCLYKPAYRKLGELLKLTDRTDLKFDTSCSNISHPCFFSYDPGLYINEKAQPLSLDVEELKKVKVAPSSPEISSSTAITRVPGMMLKDPREIKETIVEEHTLFERYYSMSEGQRNTNLFILASFLKDAGVPEVYARDYLVLYYRYDGFEEKEIIATVSSAYK